MHTSHMFAGGATSAGGSTQGRPSPDDLNGQASSWFTLGEDDKQCKKRVLLFQLPHKYAFPQAKGRHLTCSSHSSFGQENMPFSRVPDMEVGSAIFHTGNSLSTRMWTRGKRPLPTGGLWSLLVALSQSTVEPLGIGECLYHDIDNSNTPPLCEFRCKGDLAMFVCFSFSSLLYPTSHCA